MGFTLGPCTWSAWPLQSPHSQARESASLCCPYCLLIGRAHFSLACHKCHVSESQGKGGEGTGSSLWGHRRQPLGYFFSPSPRELAVRLGSGPCTEEQAFLSRRKQVVAMALKQALQLDRDLQEDEVWGLASGQG